MTEDMPRKRYPHLRHERNRHNTWCWYFRRGNKRTRIRGEYGSPEFMAAYEAALAGRKPQQKVPDSGTVAWLVERYKESAKFASLKASTRRVRDNILAQLIKDAGHNSYAKITRKHIQAGMDRRSKTPHAANNFLIVVSQMFQWAVKAEKISVNPCEGVDMIKAATVGFHSWSLEEVEQYRARHPVGTKARLALDLLLFLGLRRSDVIHVGRQHLKYGVVMIKTTKTGTEVSIPVFEELRISIARTKTGDLAFLTSETGRPFASANSFGNWFKARCGEAGLPDNCTAHGLRKAGATIAANSGASSQALMAMYGWTRLAMAEVYTKAADKARLAREAAERIANNSAPHLEQGCGENDENIN